MMPGMIMLWHGTVENIPSGWHLCDGTMGTPDLRNRFIVGAGEDFSPGDNNAAPAHSHAFTGDGHSHDLPSGDVILDSTPAGQFAHTTSTAPASGDTGNTVGYPPYYALCFIQKL
ncbi:hypothetical protein ES703_22723 [subsurface metagenome]